MDGATTGDVSKREVLERIAHGAAMPQPNHKTF
jgi:hypothetical protein